MQIGLDAAGASTAQKQCRASHIKSNVVTAGYPDTVLYEISYQSGSAPLQYWWISQDTTGSFVECKYLRRRLFGVGDGRLFVAAAVEADEAEQTGKQGD